MVGSACHRLFQLKGYKNLIFKTSKELDLRNQIEVNLFFEKHKPDAVIIAAARLRNPVFSCAAGMAANPLCFACLQATNPVKCAPSWRWVPSHPGRFWSSVCTR